MNYCKFVIITFVSIGVFLWTSIFLFWIWLSYEHIPCLVKEIPKGTEYDYIIVGSGTSGSVLAHQLSLNENMSVLLIEAGSTFGPLSIIPLATTLMQGTNVDWNLKTIPQKYSSKGLNNQQQSIPRGKGLGGSSQINYMLHFNGIKKDFDNWEKLGAHNWNYNAILPYLKLSKNEVDDENQQCKKHNINLYTEKNQEIIQCDDKNDFNENIINFKELSDSKIADALLEANDEIFSENVTISLAEYNIKNGCRWSVFHEFLKPSFNRKNLHILINTRVLKVLFSNNKKATSVLVFNEGNSKQFIINAKKEIILCAGAIFTPHILKLSGIGPSEELKTNKIELIHNSKFVGENYFDHLNMPLYVSIKKSESVTKDKILSVREWYRYFLYGTGILSNTAVVGKINSDQNDYGVTVFGTGSVDEKALRAIANYKQDVFKSFFPFYFNSSKEGLIMLSTCFQPKSRGDITLHYNNKFSDPLINPNYLHQSSDVECLIKGIRLAVEVILSSSFTILGPRIHWPKIQICSNYGPFSNDYLSNNPSDKYLKCIIETGALTSHHHSGTAAIGNNSESVLDEKLRVRGVKNLRVVDASVFPSPISGFPNSIIIAVAKRAADFILND